MGTRGRMTAFPASLDIALSEADRYRLGVLADRRGDSLAAVVRDLIDEEWRRQDDREAPKDDQAEGRHGAVEAPGDDDRDPGGQGL
ncbi:hypothetical protein GCM10009828_073820 [Actinoplanes couchii]|uniref:Ribbon-helix-helix protein CopG domain-containing protein n=1 Tax=Actinoplanes couchii TaxID=403638 RepID=A0ABQ3X050_9ACTN|nr:hypothetical protein Aco03nite_003130 [Actinoplanes couchii]